MGGWGLGGGGDEKLGQRRWWGGGEEERGVWMECSVWSSPLRDLRESSASFVLSRTHSRPQRADIDISVGTGIYHFMGGNKYGIQVERVRISIPN